MKCWESFETSLSDDDEQLMIVVVLHNKNPPTPCLWQAPASTQETKRKTRSERTVEGQGRALRGMPAPVAGAVRASYECVAIRGSRADEEPTEREKRRRKLRYPAFKHQGGFRNAPVKLP